MIRNPKNLVRYFGKLFSDFFIVATISAVLSGFLYKVNHFIPFILCMLMFIISLRIDFLLHPLDRDD
mgnify:FL=1